MGQPFSTNYVVQNVSSAEPENNLESSAIRLLLHRLDWMLNFYEQRSIFLGAHESVLTLGLANWDSPRESVQLGVHCP